jgi:hypothetical protein
MLMLKLSCRIREESSCHGSHTLGEVRLEKSGQVHRDRAGIAQGAFSNEDFQEPEAGKKGWKERGKFGRRRLCSRLKATSIRLGMARLQLRVGLLQRAQLALEEIHKELQKLRGDLEGKRTKAGPRPAVSRQRGPSNSRGTGELLAGCPS